MMNTITFIGENREGAVLPRIGDIIKTQIGAYYIRTIDGYTNLQTGSHITDEAFQGKIVQVIKKAEIIIKEWLIMVLTLHMFEEHKQALIDAYFHAKKTGDEVAMENYKIELQLRYNINLDYQEE